MKRALLLLVLWPLAAAAEPVQLRLTHEPPPRTLKMRPRKLAAATQPDPTDAPAAAPETDSAVSAKAPEPAVETATQLQQANADLDRADGQLNAIRERVDRYKEDDARLVELKVEAEALNRSILAISVATRPRLESLLRVT